MPNRTTPLDEHREPHAAAEVKHLLHLGSPILIDGEPVFVEAACRRNALDDLEPAM